ncbi:hypothetical protein CBR_g54231 [Chara braunii]|uniref:Uncharacterized protein n=1 Tax=Chara braunii TaxID=69332 RepID=A0A388K7D7_CHABU|nr:hypothetical protein CBR_g54231 [Chara braunii]|eukprot:GBG65939.1 hypothetical protein CBR_g54231 [Chara braunii]
MCPCLEVLVRPVSGECPTAASSVVVARLAGPTCTVGFVGIAVASSSPFVAASRLAVVAVVDGELVHAGAGAIVAGRGVVAAVVLVVVGGDVAPTAPVAGVEGVLGYSPDASRVDVDVAEPASVLAAASAFAFVCGVRVVVVAAASVGCTALLASGAVAGGCVVVGVGISVFVDYHIPVAPVPASSLPVGKAVVCDVALAELAVVAIPYAIVPLLASDGAGGGGAFFVPVVIVVVAGLVVCVVVPGLPVDAAVTSVVPHARLASG